MGILSKWRNERNTRKEWIQEKVDQVMDDSEEIKKQRIKSRENITKEVVKQIGENKKQGMGCPFYGSYSDNQLLELTRDPDSNDEPFGWPKGTVRGILAIWVTLGFLILTMLIFFLLPISVAMIFEMWKVLSGVFVLIVASYFWTRIKMSGNGPLGGMFGR
jgi:hypothetical protein